MQEKLSTGRVMLSTEKWILHYFEIIGLNCDPFWSNHQIRKNMNTLTPNFCISSTEPAHRSNLDAIDLLGHFFWLVTAKSRGPTFDSRSVSWSLKIPRCPRVRSPMKRIFPMDRLITFIRHLSTRVLWNLVISRTTHGRVNMLTCWPLRAFVKNHFWSTVSLNTRYKELRP